ncbi:hypothetical protein, conserved [Plasmodium gonderi]|uniref:Uncharacterized protein n=1 Tax=Plasmodium gonderi TaxID=77519 RepID=A0A1Y1JBT7_PLAGO|nr:hypothetical protein, conserved [Plasmodium gonderi]GAW79956.1 hypothetical protein, conserved [Plasmodium gonderi]
MINENEIQELEDIRNDILKKSEEKYDYTFIINIFLLLAHFILFIIIVFIYLTYRNDDFTNCFHQTFAHVLQNKYANISDIEDIPKKIADLSHVCNHVRIHFSKYEMRETYKYLTSFYNLNARTFVDYTIRFNKLFSSSIFKGHTSISISHVYYWHEWILFIFFNLCTLVVLLRKRKMNMLHASIVGLIDLGILYEQFIDTIENHSVPEKIVDLLICSYYLFLMINILTELSKICKIFTIPLKIVQITIKHNYVLLMFLLSFLVLIFINYFSSGEKFKSYFNHVFTFSDDSKYKNEFIYNFFFLLIYNFFFVPMITIASTTTTFLLINKNRDMFELKPLNNQLWAKLRKYFFFLDGEYKMESTKRKKEMGYEEYEEKKDRINILKVGNIFLFFLFLIFFVLKIFFDYKSLSYIDANYTRLLREPFVTKMNMEKSFDTFTHTSEYLDFLKEVIINNIMRNKKNLQNNKLFELQSDFKVQDVFVYEDIFHIFPYDVYVTFTDGKAVSQEIAIENPLLSNEPITEVKILDEYNNLFGDKREGIKYYHAYALLYNFEHNLFILINATFEVQKNGLFRKKKDVFVQEMNVFDNILYRNKLIILIFLFIITVAYFVVVMYMLYYLRNRFFLLFFGFFFLICTCFFSFNFITLKSVSYSYEYVDHIKNKNISDTFSLDKLNKFKSIVHDLLRIKVCKFYGNLFCHIILVMVVLKIYCFFFINYFTSFIKYKLHFLFVTTSVFTSVFFMSLLSSYSYLDSSISILKWTMLFYHIQTSDKYSSYEMLSNFLFFFFLFYITSIYLYIFLKKNENVVKIKLIEDNENVLPFDDMVIDDHDILLHFKAILYTLDKTFEKVRILKEKYKINQILNQQIQWYSQYCNQMLLQKNYMNSQKNLLNYYDNNMNMPQNDVQIANTANILNEGNPFSQMENGAVGNDEITQSPVENQEATSKHGDAQLLKRTEGNVQTMDPIDPRSSCDKQSIYTSKDELNLKSDNKYDFAQPNDVISPSHQFNEFDMIQKTENMNFFFTKLLNAKYDFGFLHEQDSKNQENEKYGKKLLMNFFKKGIYDKTATSRREKKKEKKRTQLKYMLTNLMRDLSSIENIKISFTYILFLKIKRHVLIQKTIQLNKVKGELKAEYQNRVLYKNHLINLQKKMAEEIVEMEKNILIQKKLKGTLIHVIEDGTFYHKEEDKVEPASEDSSEVTSSSARGVFGAPVLPEKHQK